MSKTLSCTLSSTSINALIRDLKAYEDTLERKTKLLRERIAEEIRQLAEQGYHNALIDANSFAEHTPNVSVTVENNAEISVVIASGEDAIWCEFGAGVTHNGAVGTSPNPWGSEFGLTIGSYGKGYGRKKAWGFYNGEQLILTQGTKASLSLYRAVSEVAGRISEIAREVFA